MNKKLIYTMAAGVLALMAGALVACHDEWPKTVVYDDPAAMPDTAYTNPVFEPVLADPTVVRAADGYFYAYGTEDSWDGGAHHIVAIARSENLADWGYLNDAFTEETKPDWNISDGANIWAPQVLLRDGKYYMYYSYSAWGDDNPGIGVATADSPTGPFTDQGKLFDSDEIGVRNSIDPFFITVSRGSRDTHYMFWGSFHGIYYVQMQDMTTVMPGSKPQLVAYGDGNVDTGYEGVYIYQHDGYYYFFGSQSSCCSGKDSRYHVVVARSQSITGPYVNKAGQDIKNQGVQGEPFLDGDGAGWVGPGHNAEIFQDNVGRYFILYHAVDADNNDGYLLDAKGEPAATRRPLMLDEITWVDGWPVINAGTDREGMPSIDVKRAPDFTEQEAEEETPEAE